jgi:hypothetical protein
MSLGNTHATDSGYSYKILCNHAVFPEKSRFCHDESLIGIRLFFIFKKAEKGEGHERSGDCERRENPSGEL